MLLIFFNINTIGSFINVLIHSHIAQIISVQFILFLETKDSNYDSHFLFSVKINQRIVFKQIEFSSRYGESTFNLCKVL